MHRSFEQSGTFVPLRVVSLLLFMLFLNGDLSAAQSTARPNVTFEDGGIVVSGLSPRGRVAIMVVSREPIPYGAQTLHDARTVEADASGVARLPLVRTANARTIVAVVDIETGGYSIAAPFGMPVLQTMLPPAAFRKNGDGYDFLSIAGRDADVLCVRPGKAAWLVREIDGGGSDADHLFNGVLLIDAETLSGLNHAEPLRKIQNKDIVIVIDSRKLDVFVAEVAP